MSPPPPPPRGINLGTEVGMAAAGTAGVAIAGGLAAGWNVIGAVAENLPWIGVAYHMLNEIADIVDTKNALQVCMYPFEYFHDVLSAAVYCRVRYIHAWFSPGCFWIGLCLNGLVLHSRYLWQARQPLCWYVVV